MAEAIDRGEVRRCLGLALDNWCQAMRAIFWRRPYYEIVAGTQVGPGFLGFAYEEMDLGYRLHLMADMYAQQAEAAARGEVWPP